MDSRLQDVLRHTVGDGNAYIVAKGYSGTLDAFMDLMREEGEQEAAHKALDDALDAATETDPNTDAIDEAQDGLDTANEELAAARTHYNALAGGPDGANPINKDGTVNYSNLTDYISLNTQGARAVPRGWCP